MLSIDGLRPAPGGGLLLKIDVEGGEFSVLRGAEASLSAAVGTISSEAQRDKTVRTGVAPMDIVRFLETIRSCEATVSDLRGVRPERGRPFFSQLPDAKGFGYNLLCRSLRPGGAKSCSSGRFGRACGAAPAIR